jgi:tRNA uridine 5-carboxymethylaminomethyl modification enzyme
LILAGNGERTYHRKWKGMRVETNLGIQIKGKSVVLTNGTFLNGSPRGKKLRGGRAAESAAFGVEQVVR